VNKFKEETEMEEELEGQEEAWERALLVERAEVEKWKSRALGYLVEVQKTNRALARKSKQVVGLRVAVAQLTSLLTGGSMLREESPARDEEEPVVGVGM
jgi:hypothetical protein